MHLSDFHIGKDGYGQMMLFEYILSHVKEKIKPDFVFITGDISQSGQESQFEVFFNEFIIPLKKIVGQDCIVCCVPGNHDVDRSKEKFITRDAICNKATNFFDPDKYGMSQRKEIISRFEAYSDTEMLYLDGAPWLDSTCGCYFVCNEVKNLKVGILGINTAWLSEGDQDKGYLTPGKAIVEYGLKAIAETDIKIVLGHHPLDWYKQSDEQQIRALLGKNKAIYLHGHMHKSSGARVDGAGNLFVSIQSGAAFQARENDIWVNGFLWGEFNNELNQVEIEAYHWNSKHQEWVHDMDTLPYQLRIQESTKFAIPIETQITSRSKIVSESKENKSLKLNEGWELISFEKIKSFNTEPDTTVVLSYFNGRVPNFGIALSNKIPRRKIVSEVSEKYVDLKQAGTPIVGLISGAGGEGKSTAFLQCIEKILSLNSTYKVIYRKGEGSKLSNNLIDNLPCDGTQWIIASDDADLISKEVHGVVTRLLVSGRNDIHFLLCARHTEWRNTSITPPQWEKIPHFYEHNLSGVCAEDAQLIVDAWAEYGSKGLGKLSDIPKEESVQQLVTCSLSREASSDGALLGALLQLRMGEQFKLYVKKLLDRLHEKPIIPGHSCTLLEAFTYIAAMHAENRLFLSKNVLSRAIGIEPKLLRSKILWPLGEEAAADVSGDFVFTRHRAIAEAAIDILSNTLHYEIELSDIYATLVRSSRELFLLHEFVPNVADWKYLSTYFYEEKRDVSLAIKLARVVLDVDPNDPHARVKLAQLFRKAEQPEISLAVFRDSPQTELRGFFNEWSTAEMQQGNYAISACLLGYSLSDEIERRPPDNKTAVICMSRLSMTFYEMYKSFSNQIYLEAAAAVASLGLRIHGISDKDKVQLQNRLNSMIEEGGRLGNARSSKSLLQSALNIASNQLEGDLASWITPVSEQTFDGLSNLLRIS